MIVEQNDKINLNSLSVHHAYSMIILSSEDLDKIIGGVWITYRLPFCPFWRLNTSSGMAKGV